VLFRSLKAIRGVGDATAKRIVLELGKILVRQAEDAASGAHRKGRVPTAPGEPPFGTAVQMPSLAQLDDLTELAVKAVQQLNQVPRDVALRAVQRGLDEFRAEGRVPAAVQDLIRRSLAYTE
jgi:Holliday junction resolvasome RuvABC DNA-binding subunit